ncbi:MAG: hypothetical protein WEG36_07615 [Gemmatimonadota bacterium]
MLRAGGLGVASITEEIDGRRTISPTLASAAMFAGILEISVDASISIDDEQRIIL